MSDPVTDSELRLMSDPVTDSERLMSDPVSDSELSGKWVTLLLTVRGYEWPCFWQWTLW